MRLWQKYSCPTSLDEAIQLLTTAPGPALPLAGGTDILLDLKQGRHSPVHTIVDLANIPELKRLELRDDCLFIGAGVPISRIANDPLAVFHAQALTEACGLIGGPQVRNVATLGGNVAHALPAADGTIALMCLDAEAEVASLQGTNDVPLPKLFLGPGKSALESDEIIVGFKIPQKEYGQASAFKRIMRPQGMALPIINLALWVERSDEKTINIRIAIGPGGGIPFRAHKTETSLKGKSINKNKLDFLGNSLVDEVSFRTSPQRATAKYRYHLVISLFKETFEIAWERAGQCD